ncbi:hypothetical protein FB45DRAFT_1051054 [Roridomyces roridus]|uniref:Serine-threonine/tyrosine-protein kinase catalytic domain-containing protein n=1 Tax=Roridomyces roridus TaxID=1738132 RepID=A0AAD7G300_9AGAR|nr:hypothetical protein FB45DRAFT_1051054 [Roridomyces roridus]
MSPLSISVFNPAAQAQAIGAAHTSQFCLPKVTMTRIPSEWFESGDQELPSSGSDYFVLDADPEIFATGAAVMIHYARNTEVLVCEENSALAGMCIGLSKSVLETILGRIETKSGSRTTVHFKTLADGTSHIESSIGPLDPDLRALETPIPVPTVTLSCLRRAYTLRHRPKDVISLVRISSETSLHVFKRWTRESNLIHQVEFMSGLPAEVDFLLRPTHIVTDESNNFHGFLTAYHPASSLSKTLASLHPETKNPILAATGVHPSTSPIISRNPSIAWSVKLAWATDIAASVAWLHSQDIIWGSLRTDNIILCTDGHCRITSYHPHGHAEVCCPPEAELHLPGRWRATAEGDVFALGLVLWAVAMEVGDFGRERSYVTPILPWSASEGVPGWFQRLATSCVEDDSNNRPSAQCVYEELLGQGEVV